jgi:hypothetical protein
MELVPVPLEDDGPYVEAIVVELPLAETDPVNEVIPLVPLVVSVLVSVLSVRIRVVVKVELKVVVVLPEEVVPP